MKGYRRIPFDNVVRNLRLRRYNGKIQAADYANVGIQLFLDDKFAGNLGVDVDFLRNIGLLIIKEFSGWHLIAAPNYKELLEHKEAILQEAENIAKKTLELKKEYEKLGKTI